MGKLLNFDKFIFDPFMIRIADISVRNYHKEGNRYKTLNSHIYKGRSYFEIIHWQKNPYCNREKELIEEGYEWSFSGDFLIKNGHSIDKSFLKIPETCYTLAYWVNIDHDELSPDLKFVGARPFNLDTDFHHIFWDIAMEGQKHIEEELRRLTELHED